MRSLLSFVPNRKSIRSVTAHPSRLGEEGIVKERIKEAGKYGIPFIYDGEPGLDGFLADVAEAQRCTQWPAKDTIGLSDWFDPVLSRFPFP